MKHSCKINQVSRKFQLKIKESDKENDVSSKIQCYKFINKQTFLKEFNIKYRSYTQCQICLELNEKNYIRLYDCSHEYHVPCLELMIKFQIKERLITTMCPFSNCGRNILQSKVQQILDPELYEKYQKIQNENEIQNFLKLNRDFKKVNCPKPDCPGCSIYDTSDVCTENYKTFRCRICSESYCILCLQKEHSDITCDQVKENQYVEKLNQKDFQLKKCPNLQCGLLIQKKIGCEKVECSCGCRFCFNCGSEIIYVDNIKSCKCSQKREDRQLKRRQTKQKIEKEEEKRIKKIQKIR